MTAAQELMPAEEKKKSGLAAINEDEFDALTVIGGWRVIVEAVTPTIIFLVGLNITGDYLLPAGLALCFTSIAALIRLIQRLPVRPALIGVLSMSASVFVAWKTGNPVYVRRNSNGHTRGFLNQVPQTSHLTFPCCRNLP